MFTELNDDLNQGPDAVENSFCLCSPLAEYTLVLAQLSQLAKGVWLA